MTSKLDQLELQVNELIRRVDEELPKAYLRDGERHKVVGELELAIDSFTNSIKYDQRNDRAYYLRASCWDKQDLVIADINKAIELNSKDAFYYVFRAYYHLLTENIEQSLNDCQQAIDLEEKFGSKTMAYYCQGQIYLTKKEPEKAIISLNLALTEIKSDLARVETTNDNIDVVTIEEISGA